MVIPSSWTRGVTRRWYANTIMIVVAAMIMVMLSSTSSYVAAYQSHTLTRKSGQKSLEATAPSVVSEEDSSSSDESHISEQTATGNVETIQTPDAPKDISLFYPSECPTSNRSCCPVFNGAVCGGNRGTCRAALEDDSICDITNHYNSLWWFWSLFDNACFCFGNFDGPACEYCQDGWMGIDCDIPMELVVRRDFAALDTTERAEVIDAFILAKNTPHPYQAGINIYDWLVAYHTWGMIAYPSETTILPTSGQHCAPGELTWHRHFILMAERHFRKLVNNPAFGLPYWNFTSSPGTMTDIALRWFGGDGDNAGSLPYDCRFVYNRIGEPQGCDCNVELGPFADFEVIGEWGDAKGYTIQRAFGCYTPSLPTIDVAQYVVHVTAYNSSDEPSFRPLVGGQQVRPAEIFTWPPAEDGSDMHTRVHQWIGGTHLTSAAASDPLFFLHHAFVDLLFEQWIRIGTANGTFSPDTNGPPITGAPVGQNRYECIGPAFPLKSQSTYFTTSTSLGFTYDAFNDSGHFYSDLMIMQRNALDGGSYRAVDELEMAEQCTAYEREWTLRRYAAAAAAEAAAAASESLLRTPKKASVHMQETVADHRTRTSAVKMAKTKANTHRAPAVDHAVRGSGKSSGSSTH